MSTIKVNKIENTSTTAGGVAIDSSGHVQVDGLQMPTAGALSNRNKIINGDMRIDQRNAGTSPTPASTVYTVDRWRLTVTQSAKFSFQQNQGAVTPPAGFTHYLGVTSLSAYSVAAADYFSLMQRIEGHNIVDLNWGTSNAATITLSFWVRSSLTGTFGGALGNNSATTSYPFTYTISSANTWEKKSITIAGPTTGTWETDNNNGISLFISLGAGATYSGTAGSWASANYWGGATGQTSVVGTSGATFYLTGVQLEVGEKATPFEHRSYGDELARCQRYYHQVTGNGGLDSYIWALEGGYYPTITIPYPVEMRATPVVTTSKVGNGLYISVQDVQWGGYLFQTTDAQNNVINSMTPVGITKRAGAVRGHYNTTIRSYGYAGRGYSSVANYHNVFFNAEL